MPKVYFSATMLALVMAGLMLTGCPKPPTVVEPTPQFEATPVRGTAPLTVRFRDMTDPGAAVIRAYQWEFGDGAKSQTPNPTHEYKVPGTYPVKLTVITGRGEFSARKEDYITVLRVGNLEPTDPETNTVSAEGVSITVPAALENPGMFGITKDTTPLAPDAFEQIVLMSETYTITRSVDTPDVYVYDAWEQAIPTKLSMPLLERLPVPVLDPAALFILARLTDGRSIPIPGKVENNRFVASVLRMPPKARYVVAMRPETVSEDSRALEQLYQQRLDADDNWADYWKIIMTRTTIEEIAAVHYGDIADETTFQRRDFTTDELKDAGLMVLGVAQAVHNLLAEAEMRAPTLVVETNVNGELYHNLVMYDMYPKYDSNIEDVADVYYYDYFFGHIVVDPAQLLAISMRNARLAASNPDALDIKQRLSAVMTVTEAITKSTYAGYSIPAITTRGGGPLNLPVPADRTPGGRVRAVDFMEALLEGGPIYLAQRVEDFITSTEIDAEDLDFELGDEDNELKKLGRGFGENEYAMLCSPLFFPYSATVPAYNLSGQDFFCYLHNDGDFEEPMALLIGTIEAIADEIDEYLEDAVYPVGFAEALVGMYTVMDEGVTEAIDEQENVTDPESTNLRDFYWKYLKDRAYINSGEALLRPDDVLRPPFSFNEDRFSEAGTVHVRIDAPTDAFALLPEDYSALEDVMPLSGRAVVIETHSLTNELTLAFNAADWKVDDDGYGISVAVYKEGSAGVEISDEAGVYRDYAVADTDGDGINDTVTVRRLPANPRDDEQCVNRVIVIIGNINYEAVSDVSITVNAYSDLVVPEADVIRRYVYACDPHYEYSMEATFNLYEQEAAAYVLNMTSGAWRSANDVYETVWEHQLAVIEPNNVRENTAMLLVSGGRIGSGISGTEVTVLAEMAKASQSVVALLAAVPNQPLHFTDERRSRSEDAIIAYSYDKYMNSYEAGEPELTWPALLPMTRAAVRALDTVQDFMASKPGRVRVIDNFVVAGASKRGWTTWLTAVAETAEAAAADRESRVSAIIPMVIDVLNMPAQLEHHYKAYQGYPYNDDLNGIFRGYSTALSDYVRLEIFDRFDTAGGQSLLKIVDPYTYRDMLTLPKLIANSTGDQFFLPDSSKFYFNDMSGPNYLHYAANTDHSLSSGIMVDMDTLETILAFYRAHVKNMSRTATEEVVLPSYSWEYLPNRSEIVDGRTVTYARTKVTADTLPRAGALKVWTAFAPENRDFRLESSQPPFWTYQWLPYDPVEEGWIMEAEIPQTGWRGFYGQLRFEGSAPGADFLFTTPVRVVPDNKYPTPNPDRP
ncbi:MAG TPA: PKD domain-containing protein [Candidatus Hydrogenedentes bacterium]|nr:PKD domain-containing protein [Candidatus Hydrogenedentota bacterium]